MFLSEYQFQSGFNKWDLQVNKSQVNSIVNLVFGTTTPIQFKYKEIILRQKKLEKSNVWTSYMWSWLLVLWYEQLWDENQTEQKQVNSYEYLYMLWCYTEWATFESIIHTWNSFCVFSNWKTISKWNCSFVFPLEKKPNLLLWIHPHCD